MENQEITYSTVTDCLEREIQELIKLLKSNQTEELLHKKKELDRAISWLKKGNNFKLIQNRSCTNYQNKKRPHHLLNLE